APFASYQVAAGAVDAASNSCSAAVLSTQDAPRVVVMLTSRSDAPGHCLQAVRGSDGKLLWRTDAPGIADPALASMNFVSGTVVCGRYVYAMATDGNDGLDAIALDIATGRALWTTALPPLANPAPFYGPAGLTVDVDQILICPDVGSVLALDRWNGRLRWIYPYGPPDNALQLANWSMPPTPRFDNRPFVTGDTAYFAPQDTTATFALNSRTGAIIWTSAAYSNMTLIGAVDGCAIMESDRILAVEPGAANGADQVRWAYSPRPESITGPAVVRGDVMFVPTTDKAAIPVSTNDGTELMIPPAIRPPNFRAILNTHAAEELLDPQTMGSFGFPHIEQQPPQW
ncbi:MAG TPA: PQQ-binding-like beta-propeller repeat protein, partial [Tepidisphaeraceae bacterium]|nr:PQQ-binding-like beta-propeller repeat protein [Tepidisphaeraceae bacterium]